MRVLGVDPGLTRCGLGVVEGVPGRALTMCAAGVVRTPADVAVAERLVLIERGIEEWLDRHRPEAVAVERVFSQHNVRTVMGTAQASAVAMLCAARRGLPVELHTPSEVKAAVTGTGRAEKGQVGTMVTRLLRLDAPPRPADAADALALAICHIWRAPVQQRLNRLQQARTEQAKRAEQARQAAVRNASAASATSAGSSTGPHTGADGAARAERGTGTTSGSAGRDAKGTPHGSPKGTAR
ncbi:Holliday junction endonuclease RuvC [Streptomyces sp. Amel2xB2]|uniref:crossover junction endodeoxyribonuclease RuvC n=1 Tax=Streptomyces sp. Amel2xB2 TaxID=1305829 RepID=UPI000DBA2BCB|nr:crossover junction endodeoxyribonuclease RuvC [Streptomyces sp. Amel2xB2]RAJ60604.1 Holliday junction endonuclease RuvC [Streptomyces sp. Amel2xB2]